MPLPDLTPLTLAQCPLLEKYGGGEASSLVERFNTALGEVRKLEGDRQIAPLLHSARFAEVYAPLEKARQRLRENRYAVGCIGLTQAGKSTVVNNVLGEEVCKAGSGDATSSQPGRIVRDERRSLDIEYLTPARVADRRQKLCDQLGFSTPGSDDELLEALKHPDKFRTPDGSEPPRLKEDLEYLKEFLKAQRQFRSLLSTTKSDQPYESRYAYTTHAPGGPGAEVLLVREARFRIDNAQIPPDLELCDLPGLDSKRSIDDIVTWEYLPELHGTFLFVNVGMNLLSQGTLSTLARIQKEFKGTLAGRTWLILNKMDTLTGDHFRTGGQDNIFVTIRRLLERTGIAESQVCFSSKKIWDARDPGTNLADSAFAARTMNQSGERPIPESCPEGLRNAWNELLKDGGISRIRRLMFEEVAHSLAAQIRRDVAALVEEFESTFASRVMTERRRLSMASEDLQAAMTCYSVVLQLQKELSARLTEFPILLQEGERLRQSLARLFDEGTLSEVLANLPASQLPDQFRTHARVLDQRLQHEVMGESLERLFQVVGQKLDGLPPVPIGREHQSCKETWQRFEMEDRASEEWLETLPGFLSEDVIRWLSRPSDGVDGVVYVNLMREKISAAVRQTMHTLRARLRERLGSIAGDLALLTGGKDANGSA